jgi:LacI family transcriptional regulator
LAAAKSAGLPEPAIEAGEFSEEGGYQATIRLISARPDITAIYTSTLNQAIGSLHALREAGLSVPEDMSVISYDDLPLAEHLQPPLTTIAMPLLELGRTAVDALCAQLNGERPSNITIDTRPDVVIRSSTSAPRKHESNRG